MAKSIDFTNEEHQQAALRRAGADALRLAHQGEDRSLFSNDFHSKLTREAPERNESILFGGG